MRHNYRNYTMLRKILLYEFYIEATTTQSDNQLFLTTYF